MRSKSRIGLREQKLLDHLPNYGIKKSPIYRSTPSQKFTLSSYVDQLVDTAIDEEHIKNLYERIFIFDSIQHWVSDAPRPPLRRFSTLEIEGLITSILYSVIMARAMGRDTLTNAMSCLPYLCLNLSDDANYTFSFHHVVLRKAVERGDKLNTKYKSILLTLPSKMRILWTIAWVINRCRNSLNTRIAALPLCLESHMNLLCITFSDNEEVLIELFEPNGVKAIDQSIGNQFIDLASDLKRYQLVSKTVKFKTIGAGIQTAMGVWKLDLFKSRSHFSSKGYPVCCAICVWAFHKFISEGMATLEEFDSKLFQRLQSVKDRHDLQREFISFLESQVKWVESDLGRDRIKKSLSKNFSNSNVIKILVRFGGSSSPLYVNM